MSDEQKLKEVEEKTGEKELEKVKAEWDKDKQQAQQEHANYVKATEEKTAIAEELQAQLSKVAELEGQLATKTQTTDYPDLDPDLIDKNVIKSITQMKTDLKAEKEKVAALEGKAEKYEQTEQQKVVEENRQKMIEKIHKPLDDEFGAKHRNAARELADELVNASKEKEPQDAIEAMILMRKCYKQVSEKKESKESVRTDDGKGGITASADTRKAGTTEEVLADMKKDKSWLE